MSATTLHRFPEVVTPAVDAPLLGLVACLLTFGLVMVASASIEYAERTTGQGLYYVLRHAVYMSLGLILAGLAYQVPLRYWERLSPLLFLLGVVLLALILIPGIGKSVNGSTRWLKLGFFQMQVSEWVKLFTVLYIAGYVVRRVAQVRNEFLGFFFPLLLVGVAAVLLLAETDLGATSVVVAVALGMLFLAGARLWQFALIAGGALGMLATLAVVLPGRLARVTGFLDPWEDQYGKGFQLTQSLMAFGNGEWLGAGLGGSVVKLAYLPEAHTDFIFAVVAEEFGLVGVLSLIGLFALLVHRIFYVGEQAERVGLRFGAFLAYGIGLWWGMQACVNMGVNMGLLPTKGLTLPFISYGGNSILVGCISVALLTRVVSETELTRQVLARKSVAKRGKS